MRILILAALASWARPAAGFATTPSDPIYVADTIDVLVAVGLHNCNDDETAAHKSHLERAATKLVEGGDENHDGILTAQELYAIQQVGPEARSVADAVLANPPTDDCVIGAVLPLVHDTRTDKYYTAAAALDGIICDSGMKFILTSTIKVLYGLQQGEAERWAQNCGLSMGGGFHFTA